MPRDPRRRHLRPGGQRTALLLVATLALTIGTTAGAAAGDASAGAATLSAGAARVDITPSPDEGLFLAGYQSRRGQAHHGTHDPIFARALVLDDGTTSAAIVIGDVISFNQTFSQALAARIAAELGIPEQNVMIAATHTHGAPSIGTFGGRFPADSNQGRYIARLREAMFGVVKEAQRDLRPARIGAGSGRANVNINRRAISADGTLWLGMDPDGPSDKTVAVVKVETTEGQPIAIFINYAVHGTGMGGENFLVTGDVPGATSRRVEQHYGGDLVALWSSGAAGDQCPLYDRNPSRFDGVDAVGRILGDEVIRVADGIHTVRKATLRGARAVVTCPGHRWVPAEDGSSAGVFEDTDPVDIQLSLLRAGDVVLAGVGGEVLTRIGQRFKREAGSPNAIMVTHAGGAAEYIPDDASYDRLSYEIKTSRVKRGCAEDAIVDGLLRMMRDTARPRR